MLTATELVGRARELAPRFAAQALATDRKRAPLDETIKDLIDSGVLATLVPRMYGGHEAGIATMSQIAQIFSAASPSIGWVAAFYMGAGWRTTLFGERVQREVFADKPFVLSAGQAAPLREVKRVGGGFVISGQTPWSSGSVHAEWILFMGVVVEDGRPNPLLFLVPRSEVTIVDTWFITGMSGTGSNDVMVEGLFVPEYRSASFVEALGGTTPGQRLHSTAYQLPFVPFTHTEVVPVVVGALRGAATALQKRITDRQGTLSGAKAAGKAASQMRLGRVVAAADAAEILLDAYVTKITSRPANREELIERAGMKLRGSYITNLCRDAVNDLARGIGGDGFRDDSPLQRYFRDINVVSVHAFRRQPVRRRRP